MSEVKQDEGDEKVVEMQEKLVVGGLNIGLGWKKKMVKVLSQCVTLGIDVMGLQEFGQPIEVERNVCKVWVSCDLVWTGSWGSVYVGASKSNAMD